MRNRRQPSRHDLDVLNPRPLARHVAAAIMVVALGCSGDDQTAPAEDTAAAAAATSTSPASSIVSSSTVGSEGTLEVATTTATTTDPVTTAVDTTAVDTTAVNTTAATSTPPVDVPSPAALGPYGVGRTTVAVTDETRARPLTIDVWYPIAPGTAGAPAIYSFAPGIELPSAVALADTPAATDGPFPLVVYSHGSGGLRYIAAFFTETLASHGFVVAAPDHTGNTAVELLLGGAASFEASAVDRPLDVSFVVDQLLAKSADPADALAGSVDAERIGVAGHSFGGYTALAGVSGITVAGTAVPADPRVGAIVAMAPATQRLADAELAAVDVPTMLLVGTSDRTTPVDPNVTRPWALLPASPRYRVELAAAGHQSFTDVCRYQRDLPTLADVPELVIDAVDSFATEGCAPELMPIERAHELTNTYAISFFQAHLAGNPGYAALIEPDAVIGADVTVEFAG